MVRIAAASLALALSLPLHAQTAMPIPNELIDYGAFARSVDDVRKLRETRRVSEEEFIRMAAEPGTVVLDARSERLYGLRHIRGAVNLSFPEFTAATLARVIPSRDTRVLIYCNNNFRDLAESMPTKAFGASLNAPTFVQLYTYGYRNVYELGPAVNAATTKLKFDGLETRLAGMPPP
jgi:hypothetical protein